MRADLDTFVTENGVIVTERTFKGVAFETNDITEQREYYLVLGWKGGWAQVAISHKDAGQVADWAVGRAEKRAEWEERLRGWQERAIIGERA